MPDPLPHSLAATMAAEAPEPDIHIGQADVGPPPTEPPAALEVKPKRKPGRPKGSRNKKRKQAASPPPEQSTVAGPAPQDLVTPSGPGGAGSVLPPPPPGEAPPVEDPEAEYRETGEVIAMAHEMIGVALCSEGPAAKGPVDPAMGDAERQMMVANWTKVAAKYGWKGIPVEVLALASSIAYVRRISTDPKANGRLKGFFGWLKAAPGRFVGWLSRWRTSSSAE